MRPSSSTATRSASATVEGRWATTSVVVPVSIAPQPAGHRGLGGDVERRERVVQHEHPRPDRDGTGEGDALALTAGQAEPLLADDRVEPVGQPVREAGAGDLEGLFDERVGDRTRTRRCRAARSPARRPRTGSGPRTPRTPRCAGRPASGRARRHRRSGPSPPVTSYSRGTSWSSVVLPLPVRPTSAIVSPGSIRRSTPSRIARVLASPGCVNPTPTSSTTDPAGSARGKEAGWSGSRTVEPVSMTSMNRSVAARASSVIASSMPSRSTGLFTTAAVAKNATSAPTLSWSLAARVTPRRATPRASPRGSHRARTRPATASAPCAPRSSAARRPAARSRRARPRRGRTP